MRKNNKPLIVCVLALVITLILNQSNLSAASHGKMRFGLVEEYEPQVETQALIDVYNTEDSFLGLTIFTVFNVTKGIRNPSGSHLLFVNNTGKIVKERFYNGSRVFWDPHMFNETTIIMHNAPDGFIALWNLETNTEYTISAINGSLKGHHDAIYNPETDTFMTIGRETIEIEDATLEVDTIWEFDWNGDLMWEWSMADWRTTDWISIYQDTQCLISNHSRPNGILDYSHANTIYWDPSTNILYLNARNLDNVWAIEYPSGKVLWIAGRNGDFTMYDKHGVQKDSLWWHSHSFAPVPGEPNKFILFDNDLHNGTAEPVIPAAFEGPDFHTSNHSRIVEVEIDPETMIMRETWSWSAPPEYYSPIWGDADRLPNGNRLGCFGSRSFREGYHTPPPPFPEGGAALIEVNEAGDIVWKLEFPTGYGVYRARRFQPSLSLNSPTDLTCDQGVNDCPGIIWTGKSVFKNYYQITKDGELLVKDMWMTPKIGYELPSDLAVGTYEYTLTVFDLAGQSVSDTVKVTVKTPTTITVTVFEILVSPVGVLGVLVVGLTTVGLLAMFKRKK
ncbi:MAG: aryl-sulfate sulfotransferase, partial [Candidatus Heimdallarchaeota archaeon]